MSASIAAPASGTVDIWIPIPPREDGQDVETMRASVVPGEGGYDLGIDARGNRVLHVRRPKGTAAIDVRVTLAMTTTERHANLQGAGERELNEVERKALARELEGAESGDEHERPIDLAQRVLQSQHSSPEEPDIFLARMRTHGIPARRIDLLMLDEKAHPRRHVGIEIFLSGCGWIELIDLAGKSRTEREVVVARGEHIQLVPPIGGPPLDGFWGPYAEIDGKPVEIATRVEIHDR